MNINFPFFPHALPGALSIFPSKKKRRECSNHVYRFLKNFFFFVSNFAESETFFFT